MDRTNVIGEKVKSLRTAKEISLEELADRTGLAVEQITRIEENIDIPSLAPLVKLARALGVRLGTFLDDQPDEAGPVVCRRGDADDTISFSNNALDARQHLHYHSLSRSKTDRHMEPFIVDIDANGNNEFHLSAHEGEEFIMVLKGHWKSIMVNTRICWKKVIRFITIPSYLIMYMLSKDRKLVSWL